MSKNQKHANKELSKMKRFKLGIFGSCKNTPTGYDGILNVKILKRQRAEQEKAFSDKYGLKLGMINT